MPDALTTTDAIANTIRLLQSAEMVEPNLPLMEAYTRLAECWVAVAGLLQERE